MFVLSISIFHTPPVDESSKKKWLYHSLNFKEGDIITGVNGEEITCMSEINSIKNNMKAGDSMELTIYRSGKTLTIRITLVDQADLAGTSATQQDSSQDGQTSPYGRYGYTIP